MDSNLFFNIATIAVWSVAGCLFVYFWLKARREHERRERVNHSRPAIRNPHSTV